MNVTNRRKSTDADTPTTQPTRHHQQQLQQQHNHQQQQLLAYVSCRQAATATRSRQEQLQRLLVAEDNNDDQEQVVTSTSSDCLLPLAAEGEGEEVTLELEAALVTSPARITSSTNNYEILTYNSDSLSLEEMVMPSTSDNCRLDREGSTTTQHHLSINTRILKTNNHTDMVARDTNPTTVAEAGDCGGGGGGGITVDGGGASTSSSSSTHMINENHKIILKLPKTTAASSSESQLPNSLIEDDLRKVEPLKINLHNTHHTSHHTPKITIKPIVKEPAAVDVTMSSEECSSSAEDEVVSKLKAAEPHIVPKLTIRAKNEELSTIVPKLTIKISDSTNANSEGHNAPAAANTPPLPKLTIKTGQDGHSESIITNVSPASSTTSSSSSLTSFSSSSTSTNIHVATNSSTANAIPKLTIKPLQKSHENVDNEHPSIPKLCIKGNMICGDATEDASTSKIPKLTIKTGQEHAVIITQHNDTANASGGGIPKLTIKTKSLDLGEDSSAANTGNTENSTNEKIPKITIKTNSMDSPNIVVPKRSFMKTQLDSSPLSPKQQAVPKLTITRQQNDMVVSNKHIMNCEEDGGANNATIPKMTIKTQSKTETVPKLTIKNISSQQRPSSTEESGLESDNDDEVMEIATISNSVKVQPCKTVPKLTIKNLGSPQQKLTVVREAPEETIKSANAIVTNNAVIGDLNNPNLIVTASADSDEFADLLTVDNGGESSNSQEFCGFNDNTADLANPKVVVVRSAAVSVEDNDSEIRRNSDDMDIDEDLQTAHEPQIFKNDIHFTQPTQNLPELLNGKVQHPKVAQIIDTVDLTSSPSRSNSPAQFDYNDDSNSAPAAAAITNNVVDLPTTNILLERLQRDTTVIQNTQQLKQQLLQAEQNATIPPPLQPKPNSPPASVKYPQLAERLLANGTSPNAGSNNNNNIINAHIQTPQTISNKEENIIDSIEILDTPEGSPRNSLDERPENLPLLNDKIVTPVVTNLPNGLHIHRDNEIVLLNNNNSNLKRHAMTTNLAGQTNPENHIEENNIGELSTPPSKQRKLNNEIVNTKNPQLFVNNNNEKVLSNSLEELNKATVNAVVAPAVAVIQPSEFNCLKQSTPLQTSHQRARKQKHENLLPIAMEEVVEGVVQSNSMDSFDLPADSNSNEQTANENATPVQKKRGRPKKGNMCNVSNLNSDINPVTPQLTTPAQKEETPQTDLTSKSRRVQLLRKRLAIDMVDADEPLRVLDELESSGNMLGNGGEEDKSDNTDIESHKRERSLRTPLRASRRSNTPTVVQMESKTKQKAPSSLAMENNNKRSLLKQNNENNALNHFLETNSSSSISSSSVSTNSSATLTQSVATITSSQQNLSMATQIDLTMSSSSSSSNGSTTNTITTVEATNFSKQSNVLSNTTAKELGQVNSSGGSGGSSCNNSMLPPTTILSSSDPLPDVIFKPNNDFSSILATQQLRSPMMNTSDNAHNESQDEDMAEDVSGPDNSGDDSASSSSNTPGGRGRGRGRASRGGRGRAYKAHRLGRNASAVSKAIAMNRPRCVGALKHTPDPDRIKGLYSPSPSVFEEDTRMSADLSQNNATQADPPKTPTRQPEFLNNEESQSSIISNTSILDPNNVAALQNGSAVKKPIKRKKMEVCVAEDAELTVASIAEYDWPPPKGCCPSKNRDTFMIQEQVALYLGIKSFKRKYPDLPRRQIDMEERNYLQEKNLVSEKMCDLGITAVWASDILDIMYTDFYDKYEEYKDFVRQKHLREIEAKQKSLGLNVAGRGLQARERAMLSTSKWNAYFNRTRKEERLSCLDLQTLTINKPTPASAPLAAIPNRPVAEAVARAAKAENIPQPPTLLKERVWEPLRPRDVYYPLSLVPGQFCEKYYEYTAQELRQFPLNTILEPASNILPPKEETTDTDSAAETIDYADGDKSSSISASERLNKQRRIRRIRAKHTRKLSNYDEFKVPPLPGTLANSSTESDSSSSDDSSTDTDTDSSTCSSSSSDDSSEDENSPATCGVCQHPQNRNLKDIPELFVQCYTCRRKVHPSCIEMPHRMANRVRNYNWQCADCKCCIKCKRKQDQNKMLFCEQCDRGFHIYCLAIKAVPEGRWSCERCSICMRCGATKPEGLPILQPNGEKLKVKHRKLKWINEYRIDHITKLREHCSMLCVPCGRTKNIKRVQINTHNNTTNTYLTSPGSSTGALSPSSQTIQSPAASPSLTGAAVAAAGSSTTNTITTTTLPQVSPNTAITQQMSNTNTTTNCSSTTTTTSSTCNITTAKTLENQDTISTFSTPQIISHNNNNNNTTAAQLSTSNISSSSTNNTSSSSSTSTTTTTGATTASSSGGAPPVVA